MISAGHYTNPAPRFRMTHYAIVTEGRPKFGTRARYYTNPDRAITDAQSLGGGSLGTVRVVECPTRKAAMEADIGDRFPVVWHG